MRKKKKCGVKFWPICRAVLCLFWLIRNFGSQLIKMSNNDQCSFSYSKSLIGSTLSKG